MPGSRRQAVAGVVALAVGVCTPSAAGAATGGPGATGGLARGAQAQARAQAHAQQEPTTPGPLEVSVVELRSPSGDHLSSADQINERGQAVVTAIGLGTAGVDRAAVWHRGTVTLIDAPEEARAPVVGWDISERGQVVGGQRHDVAPPSCCSWLRPFSWRAGVTTPLPLGPATDGVAMTVNERGQVLGWRVRQATPPSTGVGEAVVWQGDRVTVAPADAGITLTGWDINNRGQALVRISGGGGAVWQVGGGVTPLGTLGGDVTEPVAIDERGRVVGASQTADLDMHAFLWADGEMIDLGTLGGDWSLPGTDDAWPATSGRTFNELGQVAGTSETAGGQPHAFLWSEGEMIDLGTLGGPDSHATAINNRGQVVGYSTLADGTTVHAFLWSDGEMIDLGAVVGDGTGPSRATDINDRGQITGWAAPARTSQAVLWTTRPTPADAARPARR